MPSSSGGAAGAREDPNETQLKTMVENSAKLTQTCSHFAGTVNAQITLYNSMRDQMNAAVAFAQKFHVDNKAAEAKHKQLLEQEVDLRKRVEGDLVLSQQKESKLAERERDIEDKERSLATHTQEMDKRHDINMKWTEKLDSRSKALEDKERLLITQSTDLDAKSANLRTDRGRIEELSSLLDSREKSANDREKYLQGESERLLLRQAELDKQTEKIHSEQLRLLNDRSTAQAREQALKEDRRLVDKKAADAKEMADSTEALHKALRDKESKMNQMQTDLDAMDTKLKELSKALSEREASIKETEVDVEARTKHVKNTARAQDQMSKEHREQERRHREQASELKTLQTHLEGREEDARKTKQAAVEQKEEAQKVKADFEARSKALDDAVRTFQPKMDELLGQQEVTKAEMSKLSEQREVLLLRWGENFDSLASLDPLICSSASTSDSGTTKSFEELQLSAKFHADITKKTVDGIVKTVLALRREVAELKAQNEKLSTASKAAVSVKVESEQCNKLPFFSDVFMYMKASDSESHSARARKERPACDDAMAATDTCLVLGDGVGEGGESSGSFARSVVKKVSGRFANLQAGQYKTANFGTLPLMLMSPSWSIYDSDEHAKQLKDAKASTTLSVASLFPSQTGYGISMVEIGDSQMAVLTLDPATNDWKCKVLTPPRYFHMDRFKINRPDFPLQINGHSSIASVMKAYPDVHKYININTKEMSHGQVIVIVASDGLWDNLGGENSQQKVSEAEKKAIVEGVCRDSAIEFHGSWSSHMTPVNSRTAIIGRRLSEMAKARISSGLGKKDDISIMVSEVKLAPVGEINLPGARKDFKPTPYSEIFCSDQGYPNAFRDGVELHSETQIPGFLTSVCPSIPLAQDPALGGYNTNRLYFGWKDHRCVRSSDKCKFGNFCLNAHGNELRCETFTKYGFCPYPRCKLRHDVPRVEDISEAVCAFQKKVKKDDDVMQLEARRRARKRDGAEVNPSAFKRTRHQNDEFSRWRS